MSPISWLLGYHDSNTDIMGYLFMARVLFDFCYTRFKLLRNGKVPEVSKRRSGRNVVGGT